MQEYLSRHYAEVERQGHWRGRPAVLPYTTSGHTILKKSSTDPTSDRGAACGGSVVPVTVLKHTTFSDRVTVVDDDGGQVHEEPLRDTDDDSTATDSIDGSPPSQSTGFFLIAADPDSTPADEVDASVPEPSPTVPTDDMDSEEPLPPAAPALNSGGLMSIFSRAATMEMIEELECDVSADEPPKRKTSGSLPPTKHVELVELMAQIRAEDDAERS